MTWQAHCIHLGKYIYVVRYTDDRPEYRFEKLAAIRLPPTTPMGLSIGESPVSSTRFIYFALWNINVATFNQKMGILASQ